MNKRFHQYRLKLSFTNHDNIFEIIERIRKRGFLADEQEAAEFAIGLKLFTEVLIRNRNHELLQELSADIGKFMKRLKNYGNEA